MDPPRLNQGWHTQFLTKFQKLDGFGLLAPCRVCSRYAAYASPDIFCTPLACAHQFGAWRAGGRPFRPAGAAGGGGGAGGAARASPGAVLRAIRAESGDRERRGYTRVFLSKAAAPALRTALHVKNVRLQGIPDGSDVTALYASLIDVQLRPWPFVPRPSPATEKRRHFSPRPFARSTAG